VHATLPGTLILSGKHNQIADILIQDILTGHYHLSERLPSERDLAARYEASRGAVREAMKTLEQIGLIEVQPGGARVKDIDEASLDVISHLLAQGQIPDVVLIDHIMTVIDKLICMAAEESLKLASNEELGHIRALVRPMIDGNLSQEEHALARFGVMKAIIKSSRNLPLRLISRTLFEQIEPAKTNLHRYVVIDMDNYRALARKLDKALRQRDIDLMQFTYNKISELNRDTMLRAFKAARADIGPEATS